MIFFVLVICFVAVNGNGIMHGHHSPQPYNFGYTIRDKEGMQHRYETGNGAGVVEGKYGYIDNKGIHREVSYMADHAGFRAAVKTNEPGTAGQSPAAVAMMSHRTPIPHVPRMVDPVVPALHKPVGAYGFPSIYGHKAYGPAPYTPVYSHGHVQPMHYAPVYGKGRVALLQEGYGYNQAPMNGYGYGLNYGPNYMKGLATH